MLKRVSETNISHFLGRLFNSSAFILCNRGELPVFGKYCQTSPSFVSYLPHAHLIQVTQNYTLILGFAEKINESTGRKITEF